MSQIKQTDFIRPVAAAAGLSAARSDRQADVGFETPLEVRQNRGHREAAPRRLRRRDALCFLTRAIGAFARMAGAAVGLNRAGGAERDDRDESHSEQLAHNSLLILGRLSYEVVGKPDHVA